MSEVDPSEDYLLDGYRQGLASWRDERFTTPLGAGIYVLAFATGWQQEMCESRPWNEVPHDMIPSFWPVTSQQNGEDTHVQAQNEAYTRGRNAGFCAKQARLEGDPDDE